MLRIMMAGCCDPWSHCLVCLVPMPCFQHVGWLGKWWLPNEVEGYSISDYLASATLQVFEYRKVLITYYVKNPTQNPTPTSGQGVTTQQPQPAAAPLPVPWLALPTCLRPNRSLNHSSSLR
ncbi:Protein pecanex [Lucilia cuprina]|nr:Protein pecanex [Lucilia cuprina]